MKSVKLIALLALAGIITSSAFAAEKKAPAKKAAPAPKQAAPQVDVWAGLPAVVAEINGTKVAKDEVIALFMTQFPDGKLPPFFTAELVNQVAPRLVKAVVADKLINKEIEKSGFKKPLFRERIPRKGSNPPSRLHRLHNSPPSFWKCYDGNP